jgi:hypothetical protein
MKTCRTEFVGIAEMAMRMNEARNRWTERIDPPNWSTTISANRVGQSRFFRRLPITESKAAFNTDSNACLSLLFSRSEYLVRVK